MTKSNDCVIGYSGFIGGNLMRQHDFVARFNSGNIDTIRGKNFDTVVCAAAPGSMLQANAFPEKDLENVSQLCDRLSSIQAERFVLISSIAVLANTAGGNDENTKIFERERPYGKHRRLLETFCLEHFDEILILRLPSLYGVGLKKNFLFDILNPMPTMLSLEKMDQALAMVSLSEQAILEKIYRIDEQNEMFVLDRKALERTGAKGKIEKTFELNALTSVQFTHSDSTFQYYGVDQLWADITVALAQRIRLLHLANQPLTAAEIHLFLTGRDMPETEASVRHEDMRTLHTEIRGHKGIYLEDAQQVLKGMMAFAQAQTGKK